MMGTPASGRLARRRPAAAPGRRDGAQPAGADAGVPPPHSNFFSAGHALCSVNPRGFFTQKSVKCSCAMA